MPELPEVETVRLLLYRTIRGKTVDHIDIFRKKNIEGDAEVFARSLQGATIDFLTRKGKWLFFHFSNGRVVSSHLRMEGKYFFYESDYVPGKHDILAIHFVDGGVLAYNDVRKFGRLALWETKTYQEESPYALLGPEPFDIDGPTLHRRLAGHRRPIKETLLDQTVISGLGNIYVDETLFAAKIHPLRPAEEISENECTSLINHAIRILNLAIEEGGSTIRSYHPGKGIDGMMQVRLQAYGNGGKPCPRCHFPLRRIEVGGRGTTYCPLCQKRPTRPFVVGLTGPIHAGKSTVSKRLAERGYIHFDADIVAKEAYFDKEIKKTLQKVLGLNSYIHGQPDFALIRQKASHDPKIKEQLNGIIHPYVFARAKELIRSTSPDKKILLDVPLLYPSGMDELCDAVILIDAPLEVRRQRLLEEGKDAEALLAINQSYPLALSTKKADFVLVNDGNLDDLRRDIDALPLP